MSKIKVADFYYGAVLSMLFSNKITPALIESGIDRQIYDFTTNNMDFRLFIKYRTDKKIVKAQDYNSWYFNLTDKDIQEINRFINEGEKLVLALVCGAEDLGESEITILNNNEMKEIIAQNKTSLTVSRRKGEKAYRISMGGGRENSMQVKTNRFEELLKGVI